MLQPNKGLRQDITGLRAVAVIAVTLYHIAHVLDPNNTLFKGGFLGVDIFFVISGFLMTKIIMNGLDRGNFSLYTFYKKRAKRICPALFVTVVLFVTIAILLIDTSSLMKSCRDSLRALGFISNFWLASQTGYFDGPATERLFLHTWSLSVEWQFYLIYPLLLIVASKFFSRKVLGLFILALTIVSLVFGCIYTTFNPVNSYFLLPSRAYELLFGALAYFYPLSYFLHIFNKSASEKDLKDNTAKHAEVIGLSCILISLVVVDSSNGWPNAWSILPLIGTYLCIAAANRHTILSNMVFQKLGLWSYAIYLIHWPLIVLFEYFAGQSIAWELFPLILFLGVLLHYGVERRRNFGWLFFGFYLSLAVGLTWIIKTDTSVFRASYNEEFPTANTIANDGKAHSIGNTSLPVDFILVGDSFSRQYLGVIGDKPIHIVAIGQNSCISTPNYYILVNKTNKIDIEQCRDRYSVLIETIKQNPSVPVVWAQRWDLYAEYKILDKDGEPVDINVSSLFKQEIPLILQDLSLFNSRLYILGLPRVGDTDTSIDLGRNCYPLLNNGNILTSLILPYIGCHEIVSIDEPAVNLELKQIIQTNPLNQGKKESFWPVTYIEPADAYCNEQGCRIMQANTYEPLFYDGAPHKQVRC